jgi:hypothetical protein
VQSSKDKRNGNEEYSTFPVADDEEFTWTFLGKAYAATESLTYPALRILLSCYFDDDDQLPCQDGLQV